MRVFNGSGQEIPTDGMFLANRIIGFTEDQAIQTILDSGMFYKVVKREDKSFPITYDFQYGRINLYIQDGKVIKASEG